jgi:hypothetical protein
VIASGILLLSTLVTLLLIRRSKRTKFGKAK